MRERAKMNVNTTFFYDVTPCGLADLGVFYVHVTAHRNKLLLNKTNRRTNFSKFIFVITLSVSDSSSTHHQELSTVYSALVYVIKSARHIPVPNVQWEIPDYGQRNCPKHAEFLDKNKFGKISASVGFIKK
jgi:hypothetical protein